MPGDQFVDHGSVGDLRRALRLDATGIAEQIREAHRDARASQPVAAPADFEAALRLSEPTAARESGSTSSRRPRAGRRPRPGAARCCWPARSASGQGDGARIDRKPGELVDRATPIELVAARPRSCRAAARSWPRRSTRSASSRRARLPRRRRLDRRLHRCPAAARRGARLCSRRGTRTARRVAARTTRGSISMERTHAARLDPAPPDALALPEPVSLAVIDVSFISLTRRPARRAWPQLTGDGEIVALVKPQFEAGAARRAEGVVRDPALRRAAVERRSRIMRDALGLRVARRDRVAAGGPGRQPRVPAPPGAAPGR